MRTLPHPVAVLIKELNFCDRKITFKSTDIEDLKHTYRIYDERGIENYDRTGLPYFICYNFIKMNSIFQIINLVKQVL